MLSPTRRVVPCTITTAADGLSAAIDLQDESLVGIQMDSAWTAAAITFQGSHDGVTYGNLYDSGGTEVTIASGTAQVDRYIPFTTAMLDVFKGLRYLKVRSGTSGTPVQQAGARSLKLIARQVV